MTHPLYHTWDKIPEEMKAYPQWCISGQDKAPMLPIRGGDGYYNASPVSGPWLTFDEATEVAMLDGLGIGFIINSTDPYCCIDLDVKDANSIKPDGSKYTPVEWTSFEQLARYEKIIKAYPSYAEISPSGKGVHVWVHGAIGEGVKRDGVEVYSQNRFIRFTGWAFREATFHRSEDNVVNLTVSPEQALPITDQQTLLESMVGELRKGMAKKVDLVEIEPLYEDVEIVERAMNAANADKFNELCNGDWQSMGFPSQSEADMALMSMFTFYSHSNSQCRRLFRYSNLGKRDKAVKDDVFLNFTLTIIRTREEHQRIIDKSLLEKAEAFKQGLIDHAKQEAEQQALHQQAASQSQIPQTTQQEAPQQVFQPQPEDGRIQPQQASESKPWESGYNPPVNLNIKEVHPNDVPVTEWPPGLTGALARYLYDSSHRPVREVAIVSALGMLAGICGKAWNVSGTGLNIYMILVANSGIGKEAMSSSTAKLIDKMRMSVPLIGSFVNYKEFASGPALMKGVAANQSFVNISSEWGKTMKRLADETGRDSAMASLRTALTKLYSKSGASDIVGGATYSDKEKNVNDVTGAAFSLIGETTPGSFFDSLTENMMEDGMLSRFDVMEYLGPRPEPNDFPLTEPDTQLLEAMCSLSVQSLVLLGRYTTHNILFDQNADLISKTFRRYADDKINEQQGNADEVLTIAEDFKRALWNRAHLKFLRIAGLLAVADNCVNPCINMYHAQWAQKLVLNGIAVLSRKMESGEIGSGENACLAKVRNIMRQYLIKPVPKVNFEANTALRSKNIISRRLLQQKTANIACFRKSRQGSSMALANALKTLLAEGSITMVKGPEMFEISNMAGDGYRILDLN